MTKDESLKLALEALEEAWYHVGTFQPTEKAIDLYDEARTAIKEALAQPEQDWKIHPKEDAPLVKWAKEQTPPQRTWVGLTDDDKVLIKHDANFNQFMTAGEYADRVQQLTEARLKDLNT